MAEAGQETVSADLIRRGVVFVGLTRHKVVKMNRSDDGLAP